MKTVDLIEVTAEEVGSVPPRPGMEIVFRQARYRVVHVKPPPTRSARWTRQETTNAKRTWKLLVEKVTEGTL